MFSDDSEDWLDSDDPGDGLYMGGSGPVVVRRSPAERLRSLVKKKEALERQALQNGPRRPPHSMFGRISDRPRAALPAPPMVIAAGCSAEVHLCPQRPMRGPYWLGMTAAEHLVVQRLQFGNECVFNSAGDVPGSFFDSRHLDRLIPLSGPVLNCGMRATVTLRNPECFSVETVLTVWGNSIEDCAADMPFELPPAQQLYRPDRAPVPADLYPLIEPRRCRSLTSLERYSIDDLQATHCPACGQSLCGFALAERHRRRANIAEDRIVALAEERDAAERRAREQSERFEQLELERKQRAEQLERMKSPEAVAARAREVQHKLRRDADFLATGAHLERSQPYEPGDVWETACDES